MPKLRIPIGAEGPIMELSVWVDRITAHAMIANGLSLPRALNLRALIDTGSDITAIHPLVTQSFSPAVGDRVEVSRPGLDGGPYTAPLHDIRVAFSGPGLRVRWIGITAVGLVPASPGVLAIIGRDLLARCRFLYDGPKAEILLAY